MLREHITTTDDTATTRTRVTLSFFVRLLSLFEIQGEMHMQHTVLTPRASRTKQRPAPRDDEQGASYDEQGASYDEPVRPPTSALRYDRLPPRSAQATPTTTPLPNASGWSWKKIQVKCLQLAACGLGAALLLDTAGYAAWQAISERWEYGSDVPTTHLTANFGHGGVSHVIAFLNGHYADVIELVGTNTANVYAIKISDAKHRLVKIEVEDVNGDGKPDLLVSVEGVAEKPTLLNTGKRFEWSVPR